MGVSWRRNALTEEKNMSYVGRGVRGIGSDIWSMICGNKMPTRCIRWFLLQIFLLAQHVSGTTMPIIRSSRVLYKCLLLSSPQTGHITLSSTPYRQLENQAPNTTGSNHLYNTLEFLMMGIVVPETCWASNKICNKNHLLHLVGILFPQINDDARSKPDQMVYDYSE